MRLVLRAGLALGVLAAACKDSSSPGDFTDPAALTNDLQAVDSAFATDAYRSFAVTTTLLDPAAPPPAPSAPLQPAAAALGATLPRLERSATTHASIVNLLQAKRLQQLGPAMSAAAAQGRIIPDSMYGRVFQWDATLDAYTWQDSSVSGLNGVRFILYEVDDVGSVVDPVVEVGYADLIDESTTSTLQLHILVNGLGGSPTYIDYTATIAPTANTLSATVTGFITNGLPPGANKTLTFDETFTVSQTRVTVNAAFTLNNPARTLTLAESVTLDGESFVLTVDLRIIRPGETVQFAGRVTLTPNDVTMQFDVTVNAAVRVNGRTVATISGDPADPGTVWVDAGGEPLTVEDLEALEGLERAAAQVQETVASFFLPVQTLVGS